MRSARVTGRSRVRVALAAILIAILAGTAAATVSVAPAQAADQSPILLSRDGVVWSTTLPGGIFDEFQGAVPGDTVSKAVWVHNPLSEPVTLTVRAINVWGLSSDLGRSVMVDGAAGSASLPAAVTLASLTNCATLAPQSIVPPDGSARIALTLTMLDVGSKVAQGTTGGFNVLLTVTQGTRHEAPAACDPGTPVSSPGPAAAGAANPASAAGSIASVISGALAFTGANPAVPLLVGGGLLGIGFLLLVVRRRTREPGE